MQPQYFMIRIKQSDLGYIVFANIIKTEHHRYLLPNKIAYGLPEHAQLFTRQEAEKLLNDWEEIVTEELHSS